MRSGIATLRHQRRSHRKECFEIPRATRSGAERAETSSASTLIEIYPRRSVSPMRGRFTVPFFSGDATC